MAEKNDKLQKQVGGKGIAIKGAITKPDTERSVEELKARIPEAKRSPR